MINEANQVHDDINQKFEKIDFTPVRILEALHLIFQKNMKNYNELSNPNDLKNHLDQFFKNLSGKMHIWVQPWISCCNGFNKISYKSTKTES